MRNLSLALACASLVAAAASAGDGVDLSKLPRRIAKEPAYAAKPLYGMLAFGPEAQTRVWMVLDKSKADAIRYDVLYADLNGNSDLSEPSERFTGEAEGPDRRFRLPDFKDPATGASHTEFSVRVPVLDPTVMVSLKWRGGFKIGGGYPQDPEAGYLKFAAKLADAPILWLNGDGPFRFQRWYSAKLTIGGADDLRVFVGQPGVGPSSFCAFQQHFLPESEGVQATLICEDAQGKEMRTVHRLNDRC
jgi:hypothetical protein